MGKLTVTIETDNAAFEGDAGPELSRILRGLARRLEDGETQGRLRDSNGNTVGRFELEGGAE
jgi:hypothetical protein